MKIKIAVLYGGKSTEHEVSIISALQAIENMDKNKYDIYPIYISKNNEFYYDNILYHNLSNYKQIDKLLNKLEKVYFSIDNNKTYLKLVNKKFLSNDIISVIDVAFPIVHGTNVEDGNLQGYLHTVNLPIAGCDCLSSAIGMDKYIMKQLLKQEGLPVLDAIRININEYIDKNNVLEMIEKKFNYPVIIKPINLGSSIGISKAINREKLIESLDLAFTFSNFVLIEKAIVNLREINCSVLGDKFSCETSVLEEPFGNDEILSFQDKYLSNAKGNTKNGLKVNNKLNNINNGTKSSGMASLTRKVPAELDNNTEEEIKNYAKKVFSALGCSGVVRIDFMIDKNDNKVYVNEINTIPGSLSYYLWDKTGMSYTQLLDKLIKIAIDNKRREDNLHFVFNSNILGG